MQCSSPTIAYRRPGINPQTGNHYPPVAFRQFSKIFQGSGLTFDRRVEIMTDFYNACPSYLEPVLLPCKRCMLCCRAYRRNWAYRLVCEARMSQESMYLTLTVDDDHLNEVFPDCKLRHDPFQRFMKRLRIKLERGFSYQYVPPFTSASLLGRDCMPRRSEVRFYKRQGIKYYMCGEYGEKSMRPHYHCCVFGARFPDAYVAKVIGGNVYYTSPTLKELWPYGEMTFFSDVTPDSAAYVAGYVEKKWLRDPIEFDRLGLPREYVRMSNGLGLSFFEEHCDNLYRRSSDGNPFFEAFFLGDCQVAAPRFFDEKLRLRDPAFFDMLVAFRESRRLARQRLITVDENLNEAGRRDLVLSARRKVREFREIT